MNSATDLTPPTKKAKKEKAAEAPAATDAPPATAGATTEKPKRVRAVKDPNAPKKDRAPRTDYGYSTASVIRIAEGDAAAKYRGQRKAWYESLVAYAGKTVGEWTESKKGEKDPPRGWLRFFVQDGTVILDRPAVVEAQAA